MVLLLSGFTADVHFDVDDSDTSSGINGSAGDGIVLNVNGVDHITVDESNSGSIVTAQEVLY